MKIHRSTICAAALGVMAGGVLLATGGCSSNSSNPTVDSGAATTSSSMATSKEGSSSSSSGTSTSSSSSPTSNGDAGTDSSVEDAGCTTLNVFNFLAWCSGNINGTTKIDDNDATPGVTTTTTVCLPPGDVTLMASALSSKFELGPDPWISISAADGGRSAPMSGTLSADGGTSTATVTLGTAPGCVLLCCPFASGVHDGIDAGPNVMAGCTPTQNTFGGDGGDGGFVSLCP